MLHVGDEIAGTWAFNLASYIGKAAAAQKAKMVAADYVSSNPDKPMLKGNIESYPDACVEFRLTVQPAAAAAGAEPPRGVCHSG